MPTKEKFPQTLNVTVENEGEGDDEYLELNGTIEEKAETGKDRMVAIYELKDIVTVKTQIVVEPSA